MKDPLPTSLIVFNFKTKRYSLIGTYSWVFIFSISRPIMLDLHTFWKSNFKVVLMDMKYNKFWGSYSQEPHT